MAVDLADNGRAFVAALKRGDALGAAGAYLEDARLVEPGAGIIDGRESIAAFWRAGLEAGISDAHFEADSVSEQLEFAVEVGRYKLGIKDPDDGARRQADDRGFYVLVHRRDQRGEWRFALQVLSPD